MQKYSMDKWAGIGAGAGFAIGLLRELFYQATTQIFSITELLLMSAGVAFLGGVVGAVLFGVFSVTIDFAARSNSSFMKGMIYVLIPFTVGTAADLVLLRGTYLFTPIVSLIFEGNLNGTYYTCDDWIVAEEGSYCNAD